MALRPNSQWTAVGFEPTTFTTLACWKAGALTNCHLLLIRREDNYIKYQPFIKKPGFVGVLPEVLPDIGSFFVVVIVRPPVPFTLRLLNLEIPMQNRDNAHIWCVVYIVLLLCLHVLCVDVMTELPSKLTSNCEAIVGLLIMTDV